MKKIPFLLCAFLMASCYEAKHDCTDFKTGKFVSEVTINGMKKSTTSIRTDSLVIETYEGKTDTATVRWVNDCEYILKKLHPKNMAEKQAISIRILTTSKKKYNFEFGIVGSDTRQKGTATQIN